MATILMTGATMGIGRATADRLIADGHTLIIGARGSGAPDTADVRRLDLASLHSVRSFADGITVPLDAVILNAGMQRFDVAARTIDGFEQTFAVNHLSHYLLARLLSPRLSDGGRLIFTSSGTHDPAEKTGVPPPHHAVAARLADPASDPMADRRAMVAGLRAYASSKLCNLMTARSLAAQSGVQARGVRVYAYDPGLTPNTGLARQSPWIVRTLVWPLLPLIQPFSPMMNSLSQAASGLAGLADGSIASERVYMSLRRARPTWPDPSALARDDALCATLWADSAAMVGLQG